MDKKEYNIKKLRILKLTFFKSFLANKKTRNELK